MNEVLPRDRRIIGLVGTLPKLLASRPSRFSTSCWLSKREQQSAVWPSFWPSPCRGKKPPWFTPLTSAWIRFFDCMIGNDWNIYVDCGHILYRITGGCSLYTFFGRTTNLETPREGAPPLFNDWKHRFAVAALCGTVTLLVHSANV